MQYKHSFIPSVLIAAALMLTTSLSLAVENAAEDSSGAKAASVVKTTGVKAKKPAVPAKAAKVAPKNLVDINSASKEALMKLPGIDATAADKIIAGRPYLSKAHLVTQNVLARSVYENLKTKVVAKQNKATAKKLEELQKLAEKKH
ncbi:conserved exported protein of unknown function [Georgfuchsia toluolica]|uniref:Helix-hairpin-helix domain-containing protein n=1 Tax=Georgfuchsia toluolica TaxID=424218 RepID=A0A916J6W8_9PROT|nr:helix-hairpin-helix domain-containing protein [Georgfuchsia toluolica]CAG4883521.1 conserved exported protein of unknown function [Georgfuchsia toluolica]